MAKIISSPRPRTLAEYDMPWREAKEKFAAVGVTLTQLSPQECGLDKNYKVLGKLPIASGLVSSVQVKWYLERV